MNCWGAGGKTFGPWMRHPTRFSLGGVFGPASKAYFDSEAVVCNSAAIFTFPDDVLIVFSHPV